ncbi:hypothetical protein EYF80_063038 [Liparis tanakae]|uniref:Uncharacterized protein n=1 Tax=Liparis tanakae TaxID=230148 RepID=A0A4Z2EEA1_9TELE|nr:hypothetical protein EYF80_063038 [Liparis tanakae]
MSMWSCSGALYPTAQPLHISILIHIQSRSRLHPGSIPRVHEKKPVATLHNLSPLDAAGTVSPQTVPMCGPDSDDIDGSLWVESALAAALHLARSGCAEPPACALHRGARTSAVILAAASGGERRGGGKEGREGGREGE